MKEFQKLSTKDQMFVMLDTHGEDGFNSNTTITVADIKQSRQRAREFEKKLKRMWETDPGRKKKIQKIARPNYIAT